MGDKILILLISIQAMISIAYFIGGSGWKSILWLGCVVSNIAILNLK